MKWDQRFLGLARFFSNWSKDPSTKVGAVIIDAKRRVVGEGYNGFPRGIADSAERLNDRPTKYALVVHAEANALINVTRADLEDCTMYLTLPPCRECAKLIIQSGIRKVVVAKYQQLTGELSERITRWETSWQDAMEMFEEAGVEIRALDYGD